jgi:hypothetical protein
MNDIFQRYYLSYDSKLVYSEKGTKGVDCWFESSGIDSTTYRVHRALSFEDFGLLKKQELEDLRNECELNGLENQTPEC